MIESTTLVETELWGVYPLPTEVIKPAMSNVLHKEMYTSPNGEESFIYCTYFKPSSFDDYVFVYDPEVVLFDTMAMTLARRGKKSMRMQTLARKDLPMSVSEMFPGDEDLRMISLPKMLGVSRSYRTPGSRSLTSPSLHVVSRLRAHFFYRRKQGDSSEEHAENFAKFIRVVTHGRFMKLVDGAYEEVVDV